MAFFIDRAVVVHFGMTVHDLGDGKLSISTNKKIKNK